MAYRQSFRAKAALLVQRLYRGHAFRKRLHCFRDLQFSYNENDLDCIFSNDIAHLFCFDHENEEEQNVWKPRKPEITAAASTSFAEEPSLAQEPSLALEQHQHIKNYGQVPEIHQRENSGFTKQWGISDKRVRKVSS
jgi:hypothetical protein